MLKIGEKELAELRRKAEAWDELDAKIAKFYPEYDEDDTEDEEFPSDDSSGGDLVDIGEAAARAFGYL